MVSVLALIDSDSEPLVFLLNDACMLSGEATHTYVIVLGFSRSGLKPTIYRIGGEHSNHYTTDPVINENNHIYSLSMANIDNGCYNKIKANVLCIFVGAVVVVIVL